MFLKDHPLLGKLNIVNISDWQLEDFCSHTTSQPSHVKYALIINWIYFCPQLFSMMQCLV